MTEFPDGPRYLDDPAGPAFPPAPDRDRDYIVPPGSGEVLAGIFGGGEQAQGPPYTHTFAPGVAALKRSPWWYRMWRALTRRKPLGYPPPSYTLGKR